MSKKTTFEVDDDLDRDPLDTDFEGEKPTASITQQGETAQKSTRRRVSKSAVSQAYTGGVTEDEETKKEGTLQRSEGTGGISESDLEGLEDEDMALRAPDSSTTSAQSSGDGLQALRTLNNIGRGSRVASSVETRQSSPQARPSRERRKSTAQPKSSLKEQNPQMFPPPRPIIRTLEGEQLNAIDEQHTATKEVQIKRATMAEITRIEKVEAKERNARNNL